MNTLYKISSLIILFLLLSLPVSAQEKSNFKLKGEISSGLNFTYDFKAVIPGEYKKNSVPFSLGFELVYKDTYGLRLTAGYYPLLFFSELEQYRLEDISIDASLTSRIILLSLRYYWGDFIFEAGGSFAFLKSTIRITGSGSRTADDSFGYAGGISYQAAITERIMIEPGIALYRISETESSTLTFRLALSYRLFDF